jgi:hypothetical protein
MTANVACPHCHASLATREVLDAGTVAIPESSLLHFRCPRCSAAAMARLGDGHLSVGPQAERFHADGAAAMDPSLSVRPEAAWLDCWHAGRYRRYPAAKAA